MFVPEELLYHWVKIIDPTTLLYPVSEGENAGEKLRGPGGCRAGTISGTIIKPKHRFLDVHALRSIEIVNMEPNFHGFRIFGLRIIYVMPITKQIKRFIGKYN